MWWNTIIDNISSIDDKEIRAAASITFVEGCDTAGNLYKEEKGSVQFVAGNTLRASSDMNSFPPGSVTTWKPIGGRHTKTQFLTTSKAEEKDDEDDDIEYIGTQSLRKRRRIETDVKETIMRPHIEKDVSELRVLCSSLQRQVYALQERLSSLEQKEKQQQISSNATQFKAFLRYDVMRCIRRNHSRLTGENAAAFHSVLRRCPVQFTLRCTLDTFIDLVKDLQQRHFKGVHYLPSQSLLSSSCSPFKPRYVVFNSFYTFLSWIGILDLAAAKSLLVRKTFRQNLQLLQMVGGAQWDDENNERPLHLFLGHGCIRTDVTKAACQFKREPQEVLELESDENEEITPASSDGDSKANSCKQVELKDKSEAAAELEQDVPSLKLKNAKWSEDNGAFFCQFEQSAGKTSSNAVSYDSIFDHDAFTLSWKPLPGLRPQQLTMVGDQDVLGNVSVYIPVVVVAGAELCNRLGALIHKGRESLYPQM